MPGYNFYTLQQNVLTSIRIGSNTSSIHWILGRWFEFLCSVRFRVDNTYHKSIIYNICPCIIIGNITWRTSKGTFTHARSGRGRRRAENWLLHKSLHVFTHSAERRRSGSKILPATNGSNTQFSASASKPRAPSHLCPQEMADPPASAPRICEHTRCSGAGMSKSDRLRSATAPRICERSFRSLTVAGAPPSWSYHHYQTSTCLNTMYQRIRTISRFRFFDQQKWTKPTRD